METVDPATDGPSPCQACGACCAYSSNWPRFTTEDDAALDLIPAKFVNDRQSGMRCDGDRCSALTGKVGVATSCGIYAIRPDSAEQRSPSQRIPDSLSLTNFSGIRSSAASSSVVKRGQFEEYEQQAPQPWQGPSVAIAVGLFSMAFV